MSLHKRSKRQRCGLGSEASLSTLACKTLQLDAKAISQTGRDQEYLRKMYGVHADGRSTSFLCQ